METPSFSTAATIITQVRAKTRIGANSTSTALQNTAMLLQLHDTNEWFHNYPYTIGMLGWKFNDRETIIQTKANTTLNGAVSAGATSVILVNASDFDSPPLDSNHPSLGAGYIRTNKYMYDFFVYETKSSNTLSIASGIDIAHLTSEEVHKLYALPSNFGKGRALFRESNVIEYQYLDQDLRQTPPFGYYMLKSFTSTNGFTGTFMVMPWTIGVYNFKFYYMIKANTISASDLSDKINAPDGEGRQAVIEKMCQYVWEILGEDQMAARASANAELAMDKALGKWSMHTASTNQSLTLLW